MLVVTVVLGLSLPVLVFNIVLPWGSPASDGFTLCRYTSMKRTFSIQSYATYYDMTQGWEHTASMVDQVHALRPDFKCLFYRNVRAVYPYWSDEYALFKSKGWVLKDQYGRYVYCPRYGYDNYQMVDVGNSEYQNWVANKIKTVVEKHGYDGCFLDNGLYVSTDCFWSASNPPINPRTGNYWTDNQVLEAYLSLLPKIKSALGSKLLIPNGIWTGRTFYGSKYGDAQTRYIRVLQETSIDGVMSEGIWCTYNGAWLSETDWKKSLDLFMWISTNYLSNSDKLFVPIVSLRGNPVGATDSQLATFGVASTLLAVTSGHNQIYFHIGPTDFMETSGQTLFDKANSLGAPLGNYYAENGVYMRDFENGKVYVNPTNNVRTVDGRTMNAHTGFIHNAG